MVATASATSSKLALDRDVQRNRGVVQCGRLIRGNQLDTLGIREPGHHRSASEAGPSNRTRYWVTCPAFARGLDRAERRLGAPPSLEPRSRHAELIALRVEHHDMVEVLAVEDSSRRIVAPASPAPSPSHKSLLALGHVPRRLTCHTDIDVHPVLRGLGLRHPEEPDRRGPTHHGIDDRRAALSGSGRGGERCRGGGGGAGRCSWRCRVRRALAVPGRRPHPAHTGLIGVRPRTSLPP